MTLPVRPRGKVAAALRSRPPVFQPSTAVILSLLIVWETRPEGPKTRAARGPRVHAVVFYAVVSDEIQRVIEFFPTRWEAERRLAKALWNEPGWRDILHVEQIELCTGTTN
jgi:hypothetical protein